MILEGGAILMKLNQLDTEKVNQNSLHIDEMSTIDILKTINNIYILYIKNQLSLIFCLNTSTKLR